jgi:hypothetical protein
METIVVKGTYYSFNDKKLMEDISNIPEWDKLVKIILVEPSGITREIISGYNTFKIVTEGDSSIIYK